MVSIFLTKINIPSKEKNKIQLQIQIINQKKDKKNYAKENTIIYRKNVCSYRSSPKTFVIAEVSILRYEKKVLEETVGVRKGRKDMKEGVRRDCGGLEKEGKRQWRVL